MPIESLASVFADANRLVRIFCVEFIKPGAVHCRIAAVPAEIVVVGYNVGNLNVRLIHAAHRNARHSGKTCLIHLVAEVVEYIVVFNEVGCCAAHRNLV